MKITYKFFDREDNVGRNITYEFPVPFHDNMDEDFKMQYGESLTFVKELNHRDKIIRIHSAYDSGKGTKYVAPVIKKKRQKLNSRLQHIMAFRGEMRTLKVENEYENEHLYLVFTPKTIFIFTEGNRDIETGTISGYQYAIERSKESLQRYFKNNKYYPYNYEWFKE